MDILREDNFSGDAIFFNGEMTGDHLACCMLDVVSQRLVMRLRTFRGEWFMDTDYGFPYFQKVLGRKVSKSYIDKVYREEILKEMGVEAITHFESSICLRRKYSLKFSFRVSGGDVSDIISLEGYA